LEREGEEEGERGERERERDFLEGGWPLARISYHEE